MVDDLGLSTKERVKRGLLRKFRQVSKAAALAKRQKLANGSLLHHEIGGDQMSLADVVKRAIRVLGMTEEMIVKRVAELESSVTETVFNYTRRGLFEKDKLTIASMLCLSVLKVHVVERMVEIGITV